MCMEQCCFWLLAMLEILRKQSLGRSLTPTRHSVMSHGLGLAGKSPLAERISVQLEALCGWKWWCRGGFQCPLSSGTRAATR